METLRKENFFPMNSGYKELWLKALRSGDYSQGEGKLYNVDEDTYCCLGVLCHAYGLSNEEIVELRSDVEQGDINSLLPPHLITHFGLDNTLQKSLAMKNDNVKQEFGHFKRHVCSFEDIANWIERHL